MDLQKLFDMMSNAARDARKGYHLTLGQLIFALNMWNEAGKGDRPVVLDNFRSVGNPHSYRGYYADLAFEPTSEGITVAELLKDLRENILNQKLEGYKGGDFVMDGEDNLDEGRGGSGASGGDAALEGGDSEFGGFGAAGEAADAIGHGVEAEGVIAEEAVFVALAHSADVGEGGGGESHAGRGG